MYNFFLNIFIHHYISNIFLCFKILYERTTTSKETKTIIEFQNGIKDGLANEKEMYSSSAVLRMLSEDEYFQVNGKFSWPESFKPLLSERMTWQ
jgi:hypothetical protein